jgi:ABC-type lipoprotein release transport system permease subunit
VTGSLSSAYTLANTLGKWLAVAVLAAAFCLASILTISAVSRRVREFGTLKAMGWTSRRIMGEALVIDIIGGAAGIGVGYAASSRLPSCGTACSPPAPGLPRTVAHSRKKRWEDRQLSCFTCSRW